MTEQTTPTAPVPPGHSEAPATVNIRLYGPQGGDLLLTLRQGVNLDQARELLDIAILTTLYAKDKYRLAAHPQPAPTAGPPPAAGSPVGQQAPAQPVAPPLTNGNGQPAPAPQTQAGPLTFEAQALTVALDESGRATFKVKGGKFSRWGLRIWPEVLAATGFDVNALQAGQTYSLTGYTAAYILGDNGKALKVTELSN
jgi:hypothetical protein